MGGSMMPDSVLCSVLRSLQRWFSVAVSALSGPWSLSCVQTRSHDPFNHASKPAGPGRSVAGPRTHPPVTVNHGLPSREKIGAGLRWQRTAADSILTRRRFRRARWIPVTGIGE